MEALFADIPEALQNTRNIAERCNIEIELDHPRLPRYPTGDLSPADYLRKKMRQKVLRSVLNSFIRMKKKEMKSAKPMSIA